MRQNIEQHVQSVADSALKTGGLSVATIAAGLATVYEALPSALGVGTSLVGFVAGILVARKIWIDSQKSRLEIKVMRQDYKEHMEDLRRRKEGGEPCRREEDSSES